MSDHTPKAFVAHQRITDADAAVAKVLADATPPAQMAAAPVAPARGPQRLVQDYTLHRGGLQGHSGAHWEAMDPLSIMCRRAYERHEASGSDAAFVPPFTPGQIAVGRDYRALVEWRSGSCIKCASLEGGRSGGQGGLFIDTFLDQGKWLITLRGRIGSGSGLALRRVRPSARGSRASIPDLALVDMVLLHDRTLSDVLRVHRWVKSTANLSAARQALCGALDRMMGYS